MKTITAAEIGKGKQSVNFTETVEIKGKKIRINIKSDAYDFQSYAKAQGFNPDTMTWTEVASIHFSKMKTPKELIYHPNNEGLNAKWFKDDRDTLINEVKKLLT